MPYTKTDYPDIIKELPAGAKNIWIAAYNSAYDGYDPEKTKAETQEEYAAKVAWGAVKKSYSKDDKGNWIKNESMEDSKKMDIKQLTKNINTNVEQIKNEAGKRNSAKDLDRLTKIQTLITELVGDLESADKQNEATEKLQGIDKELNEWWGSISGSQEDNKNTIEKELRLRISDAWIEAVFDDYIICSKRNDFMATTEYFKVNYTTNAEGKLEFTDPIKVEFEIVIKEINEKKDKIKWLNEKREFKAKSKKTDERRPHQIRETLTLKDYKILDEEKDSKGKTVELRVHFPVVQIADIINENKRKYSSSVLRESTVEANKLAELNALTMLDTHPAGKGNDYKVSDIIAKIEKITYNESNGTVSLDSVRFIPTNIGKDCMEVIRAGVPLQVSQRGEGLSHKENIDGQPIEIVESLQVFGYDLLPPGFAGVQHPDNKVTILEKKDKNQEVITMELTDVELKAMIQAGVDEGLKITNEARKTQDAEVTKILEEKKATDQIKANEVAVKTRIGVADFKFNRFDETQQKTILEALDYSGEEAGVQKRLDERISFMDKALVATQLKARGIGTGQGYVERASVGKEAKPFMEHVNKLNEATKRQMVNLSFPVPVNERMKKFTEDVVDLYDRKHWAQLMNEADGVAGDMPAVVSYGRVVLEQSFQKTIALNVCDVGTIESKIDQIFVETYSESPYADLNALRVGENAQIAKSKGILSPFTIYALANKLGTSLSYEALMSAKSANNYDLQGKNLASLVNDVARRTDLFVLTMMAAHADCQKTVKVDSFETLVKIGTTKEWMAINGGLAGNHNAWVQHEHIKKFDVNNNLATSQLLDVGTDSTSTLQKIIIQDTSTPPKTLVKGYLQSDGSVRVSKNNIASALADYYVRYADGSIVISDNPITPGLTLVNLGAKYTYTLNTRVWMATPSRDPNQPASITFEDHLLKLHQLTGRAMGLVANRFYEANTLLINTDLALLIPNAKIVTNAGGTPANQVGVDNAVLRWAGLTPLVSQVVPNDKMILQEMGSTIYRILDPFKIEGPITNANTVEKNFVGTSSTAEDIPLDDKLVTVSIGV